MWLIHRLRGLAAGRPKQAPTAPILELPAVGPAAGLVSREARKSLFDQALGVWRRWLEAAGPARVAHRYAAFRSRGDAPEARIAHLVCAGLLADAPAEVEPWLDAVYAIDARTVRLRGVALARAQAARWRGDEPASKVWLERYRALEQLASEPAKGELFQQLRL